MNIWIEKELLGANVVYYPAALTCNITDVDIAPP